MPTPLHFLTLVTLVWSWRVAAAQNSYPIVLVHGFSGSGRDETRAFQYWGGVQGDIQEHLHAQNHTVYTAVVGPFSSNWDRACELYAQIKGGRVDYGANHAAAHGHARFGRTFPGLFPQWGEMGADGHVQKVHLVGHSMGGQTIRMLAQLLTKGSHNAPVEETTSTHPLLAGGKDWIHSITNISTPNQGTLLADGFSEIGNLVKHVIVGLVSLLGAVGDGRDDVYDAKLDQWDISPKRLGESLKQYIDRVFASPLFAPGVNDTCLWSLSTAGAAEENAWVATLPSIYYFSYATSDTYASRDLLLRRVHRPHETTMLLSLQPVAAFLGGRYGPTHGVDEHWQLNDGAVNTVSMVSDTHGAVVALGNASVRGVWNVLPLLARVDHLAVVGVSLHTPILELYAAHAALLAALPVSTRSSSSHEADAAEAQVQEQAEAEAIARVLSAIARATAKAAESDAPTHHPDDAIPLV